MLASLTSSLTKQLKLGLACTLLASTALFASDPDLTLKISPDQKWSFSHSEIKLESKVTADDGLVLEFEPVPPPKINYIAASIPWEFEIPQDAKVRMEVRAEEARGCYLAIRFTATDGMVYQGTFGDNKTGYPLSDKGSVAELPISSFKTSNDYQLEPGTRVLKASIVVAPDKANTLYISSISVVPDAK